MEPKLKGNRWEKEFEEPIRQAWRKNHVFAFRPHDRKPIFSIDTPPPYVNSPIHMGHAATYTIMDFIARFKRMCDFNVLFPLGLDRNGLPIEVATEKKFGISIKDTPARSSYGAARSCSRNPASRAWNPFTSLDTLIIPGARERTRETCITRTPAHTGP